MNKSKCCGKDLRKVQYGTICSNCLLVSKSKLNTRLFFIIGFLSIIMLGANTSIKNNTFKSVIVYNEVIKDTTDITPCDSDIIHQLQKDSCMFIDMGIIQAHIETGWYTSTIMKENKNLFGLRCNCKYTSGYINGHSKYNSYINCCKCYVEFTNKYWKEYCNNYAENKNYYKTIKLMK
jgi:hypothetical protein